MGASKNFTTGGAKGHQADAGDRRVLDIDHLRRYTLGSRDLEREVLGIFHIQMREQLLAIVGARHAEAWKFATHTLKGAARALGAWEVAETAGRLECLDFDAAATEKAALIARLESAIVTCEEAIAALL